MPDDYGDERTERILWGLEARIGLLYDQAADEMKKTVAEYFEKFKKRDKEQRKLLEDGEITERDYTLWLLAQIGRGERLKALAEKLSQRYTTANEQAASYINDETPSVYALNRNYSAYEIERDIGRRVFTAEALNTNVGVDFVLWDEHAVKRLIKEQPDLMPHYPEKRAVDRGIDLAWGRKQITASITSAVLQGKDLKRIADDLQERIKSMNRESAIRTARTAMTTAQNAGRYDGYIAAEKMGVRSDRRWVATKDFKTRHDHANADGQTVAIDEPFIITDKYGNEYKLMFPGDRSLGAPGKEIYNCRCRMRRVEKAGIEAEPRMMRVRGSDGRNIVVKEMTYKEWEKWVMDRGD